VAVLAALLLCAAPARAQEVDPVIAGGSGLAGGAPDGTGVDVALIDSGVAPVAGLGNVVYGPDFSEEAGDPDLAGLDTFGHGTHLAGIIAGHDPVTGFSGVAPGARVVSVKISGAEGVTSLIQVLSALDWVRRNRRSGGMDIRVVNLSLGVQDRGGYRNDVLAWAAEQLWEEGIAVVAAAGNNGGRARRLDIPAADPFVIAAGASETYATADPADDRVAWFSSRSEVRPPDVVAPGTNIVSLRVPGSVLDEEFPAARVGDAFFRGSGTSQAAAVVSGLAARLIGQRPELKPDQVKALLRAGAVDLAEPVAGDGAGRVDIARSMELETPSERSVAQDYEKAVFDPGKLFGRGPGHADYEPDGDGDRDGDRDDDDERGDDDDDDRDRGKARGRGRDRDDRGRAHGRDDEDLEPGNSYWSGRRWSGRRWSGMKWSGRRWSGMKWSGMKWSGMKWSGAGWDDGGPH
jgi:serine protease AprX